METLGAWVAAGLAVTVGLGVAVAAAFKAGGDAALKKVAQDDAKATRAAGETMAESRTPGDASKRLRDASF